MNNFKHRVLRIEPNNTAVQKCAASVCVCVFFPFILDTSSLDVPAGVTQEEDHTGFLLHLLSAVRAPSHDVERTTEYYSRLYLRC